MLDDRSMPSPTAVARSGGEDEGIAIKRIFTSTGNYGEKTNELDYGIVRTSCYILSLHPPATFFLYTP